MKKITSLASALLLAAFGACGVANAQTYAVRMEASSLLLGNINVEIARSISPNAPSVSLHLPISLRPFNIIKKPVFSGLNNFMAGKQGFDRYITDISFYEESQHISVQPGIRYWTKGVFNRGLFVGVHAIGRLFKEGGNGTNELKLNYREGFALGAGLSVGYSYELASRWNLEAEFGLGGLWRSYTLKSLLSNKVTAAKPDVVGTVSRCGVSVVYLF